MTGDAAPPPVPPPPAPPPPGTPPLIPPPNAPPRGDLPTPALPRVPPVPPVPSTTPAARTRHLLGLLVSVLLLGHLLPLFVAGRGVSRLDWNLMAARWASPFGRGWDLLLIWATCLYAGLLVRDRVRGRRDSRRGMFAIAGGAAILALLAVGTIALVSFNADLR